MIGVEDRAYFEDYKDIYCWYLLLSRLGACFRNTTDQLRLLAKPFYRAKRSISIASSRYMGTLRIRNNLSQSHPQTSRTFANCHRLYISILNHETQPAAISLRNGQSSFGSESCYHLQWGRTGSFWAPTGEFDLGRPLQRRFRTDLDCELKDHAQKCLGIQFSLIGLGGDWSRPSCILKSSQNQASCQPK